MIYKKRIIFEKLVRGVVRKNSIRKTLHSGKRFNWTSGNYFFERLSLISGNDLLELNRICLIQTEYF